MASTSTLDNSNGKFQEDYDIVIVGTGLTGLTTAYNILKQNLGLSILLLEKNDTVGGRILQEKDSRAFFGSFCQENVTKFVTNDLDIRICGVLAAQGQFTFLTKDGPSKKVSRFVANQVYHFLKLLHEISVEARYRGYAEDKNNEKLAKISINELMRSFVHFKQARKLCESILRLCAVGIENLNNVSALWFIVMLNGAGGLFGKLSSIVASDWNDKRFFIECGFRRVVKKLERIILKKGGIIRLCEKVVKIETMNLNDGHESVYVTTEASRKFKCNCVVIAVPPPINSHILYESTKLEKDLLEAQNFYESGENRFFYAIYKKLLVSTSSTGIHTSTLIATDDNETNLRMAYDASQDKKPRIIAGYLSLNSVDDSSNPLNGAFRILSECFGTANLITSGISEATNEANSVNFIRPSSIKYHLNPMLLHCEKNRIFFAASEFATNWPGTADGAIEAGKKVANSIILQLRPQALETNERIKVFSKKKHHGSDGPIFSIGRAYTIFLGLNVCLFFSLLRDTYTITL